MSNRNTGEIPFPLGPLLLLSGIVGVASGGVIVHPAHRHPLHPRSPYRSTPDE